MTEETHPPGGLEVYESGDLIPRARVEAALEEGWFNWQHEDDDSMSALRVAIMAALDKEVRR